MAEEDAGAHAVADIGDRSPRPFTRVAKRLTFWAGSGGAALAVAVGAAAWVAIGSLLDYSRAWELCMTVGLPVATLLMLVLVQHTQNHDDRAVQLKLDELIRAVGGADNRMMTLEDASREDLDRIRNDFEARARQDKAGDGARARQDKAGGKDRAGGTEGA